MFHYKSIFLLFILALCLPSHLFAQQSLELAHYNLELPQSEQIVQMQDFYGSVESRALLIVQKQDQRERLLTYLNVSGITVGLEMLAPAELLRAYMEGVIVGWGGSIDETEWQWESQQLLCRETQASFGAKTFCYRACMKNEVGLKSLFFALEWAEKSCSADDKDSLAQWLLKVLIH